MCVGDDPLPCSRIGGTVSKGVLALGDYLSVQVPFFRVSVKYF